MSAPCPIPFGQLQGGQTEGSEHFTFHWRRWEGEKGDLSPACKGGSENITFVRPWRIYPGETPLLLLKSCKWVKEASPLQQIHGKFIKLFLSSLNYEPGNGPPQHCILLWERGKLKQGICSVLLKGRRPQFSWARCFITHAMLPCNNLKPHKCQLWFHGTSRCRGQLREGDPKSTSEALVYSASIWTAYGFPSLKWFPHQHQIISFPWWGGGQSMWGEEETSVLDWNVGGG